MELHLHWDGDYVTLKTQQTVNFYICEVVRHDWATELNWTELV